jgi:hypothetical protein
MRVDCDEQRDADVDEYLWPLSGDLSVISAINLELVADELQIRRRLSEIAAHVRETHLQPRIRRWGRRVSAVSMAVTETVVMGPDDAPPWQQTLKAPVPRALRDEWTALANRLRDIESRRQRGMPAKR